MLRPLSFVEAGDFISKNFEVWNFLDPLDESKVLRKLPFGVGGKCSEVYFEFSRNHYAIIIGLSLTVLAPGHDQGAQKVKA